MTLPPLKNTTELKSLQGKENFLHRFVCKYAKKRHGFMHFLKNEVPFIWDGYAQPTFNYIKHAIKLASALHPPDYSMDYLLYLAAFISTIGMVLVQEDNNK